MRGFSYYRVALTALVCILVLGIASNASAWDKERRGFILGIGMGPGYSSYTDTRDSSGQEIFSANESKFAFLSDFKIGYAPNNKLMVYWLSKVAWFGKNDSTTDYQDNTIASGVGGLGISYFLKPQAPSLFVTAGAGFSAWSIPFEGTDPWTGIGFAWGLGYEFSTNWNVEANVVLGKPKDEVGNIKSSASVFSFGLAFNVIGY